MKVIQPGPGLGPEEKWEYSYNCPKCKSVLLAEKEDLELLDGSGWNETWSDWQYYVTCVKCGAQHKVTSNEWFLDILRPDLAAKKKKR